MALFDSVSSSLTGGTRVVSSSASAVSKFGTTVTQFSSIPGMSGIASQAQGYVQKASSYVQQAQNAVSTVRNVASAVSNVSSTLSNLANGGFNLDSLGSLFGSMSGTSFSAGGWQGEVEDFNACKQMSKKLMRTTFQPEWLFRLEVSGAPSDFDLYVKDISYPHFDLVTDDEQVGAATLSWPKNEQAVQISMNVRDNTDQRVAKFLRNWAHQVVHTDGTVGLPYGATGYVKDVSVYVQTPNGTETLVCRREMFPIKCGEVSMSRENSAWMEIPVTFSQFSTLSGSGA